MEKRTVINKAERLQVGPNTVTLKATAADSGGALSVVEYEAAPGFPGPPLHVHPSFDEFFYVLAGELAFRLDDRTVNLPEGGSVYVPGDQPHTFSNPSDRPARMLVVATPGGIDEFFRAVAEATSGGQVPDPATMAELNARHGMRAVH